MGVDGQAPLGRDTAKGTESVRGPSNTRSGWKHRLLTHWAFPDTRGPPLTLWEEQRRAPPFPWAQEGSAGSVLGLLDITPAGTGRAGPLLPGNGSGLGFPLGLWWLELGGLSFFPPGVFLEKSIYCQKRFCVARLSISWSFGKRGKALLVCAPWHFCVWGFPSPSPGYT